MEDVLININIEWCLFHLSCEISHQWWMDTYYR